MITAITKWNLLFDSVSQLKYKDKLNTLTKEYDMMFYFKEMDIDYLSEYHQIMNEAILAFHLAL